MIARLAALVLSLLVVLPATAAEKWADPNLKTTKGLVLWIDAGRQPAAWQQHGKPGLATNALLDVAYDASGNGLHLLQRLRDAQPRFLRAGERAVLRFDGKDDHLGAAGLGKSLDSFTLFVHAAPRSNPGGFRGLFATHETGKNDYTTGFNVDLSWPPSGRLENVNVEGKGFGNAVNLLKTPRPFGQFRTFTVTSETGQGGVKLSLDGKAQGQRDRAAGKLAMDGVSLGARFYSNTGDPPCISGFLDGDVAEVLLFDRVLSADEVANVHGYLQAKYAALDRELAAGDPRQGVPLKTVADPPAVQVFVPGFRVRQLPVDLPNINNVRYRHDGKLIALAYNGNVYVLGDTDGDGLEDRAELFWESKGRLRGPIGMALTPPDYAQGEGVFVACKGKLVLLVDTKKAGKADKEIVVAEGWKEIPQPVDALGVALDKEGNVYFGLGTANFTNGYLIDGDGKAKYDLKSERGTILKVSPDFKKREIVATGIRFPVGLAFNDRGDLFATDQEGATWLPNGNPFDELLHIKTGKHYGFPPRHPRHLPGVIDEPSVFDYGPQHQSTCGLCFNEPVNGGPVFGPKAWRGDVFVAGYSRGKLYRTQLIPTKTGYVARNYLFASLPMLTCDCCLTPRGDLVVAAHSGEPDWGKGPAGNGKLYKITYADPDHPQPLAAWAAGSREVRVAFDRPLEPRWLLNLATGATIEYSPFARAGDRFEVLRPGYAVVQQQTATPRFALPVVSASVSADRRTLIFATAPHPKAAHYALTLPGLGRPARADSKRGELAQRPAIDLDYDLSGVEAAWTPRVGDPVSVWLPHLDPVVARPFTVGSAEHEKFWDSLAGRGELVLKTKLDLFSLLRPLVQPGSTLDYSTPLSDPARLTVTASSAFTVKLAGKTYSSERHADGHRVRMMGPSADRSPVELELTMEKADGALRLEIAFATKEDGTDRLFPLRRFVLPWAREKAPEEDVARPRVPELEGGSWLRGRKVFFSDEAACYKCHQVGGLGGKIGPDLSNLIHRDYASVLKDVRDPSAALNPDYLAHVLATKEGRVMTGVLRSRKDGKLIVGGVTAGETIVSPEDIDELIASPISLMPAGLDRQLGADKMRDLMTYLLTSPLQPLPLEREGAPPPRKWAEVEAVLKTAEKPAEPLKKLKVLLVSGPKDHGPGEHDYPLWARRWFNLLSLAENVDVQMLAAWPSDRQFETTDVMVFYSNNPGWTAARGEQLDAFLKRGGGLVYLHWAVNGHKEPEALAQRIGLCWGTPQSRFRHGPVELTFHDPKHPITRGFDKVKFVDESYWNLLGDVDKVKLLASGPEDGKDRPLMWAREVGKGRVFVSILGHYTWTFDDPLFRVLVLRGVAWTGGEHPDRLIDLATIGARVGE